MDAVWAEDETTWLSQALITKCIASEEELWAKTSLPGLADRVVVISRGSLLGGGATPKVLQDSKLLESAGLEPPVMVRLFTELKSIGLVKHIPITTDESLKDLVDLLKQE